MALYRIMRTQFDRVIKAWETYSGIHMSDAYAERMIRLWRGDEGWRYYDTTYRNLPQSLFRAAGAQNLVGRYLIADSWISDRIGQLPGIRLESKPGGYRQVRKIGDGFMKLDFVLYNRELHRQGEHVDESYTMRIVQDNQPVMPETNLITDPNWLAHMKAFDHDHRDRRLLDIADRILA
ncbi:hypothetical protein COO72_02525 [Bifidobacterium callitrichos]|nr:hypothetical protein COO72_02525 [Bifidobacterium callitrichos]